MKRIVELWDNLTMEEKRFVLFNGYLEVGKIPDKIDKKSQSTNHDEIEYETVFEFENELYKVYGKTFPWNSSFSVIEAPKKVKYILVEEDVWKR